jgi:hypothetical protein
MLTSLYFRLGGVALIIALISNAYYKICYSPKRVAEKKYEKSAKDLRAEYIKNSALELELVMCLNDKEVVRFESEMKGEGDAINDYNISTDNSKLIF